MLGWQAELAYKHTRISAAFARVKAPPYSAARQVESRFVRRFTPAIEQKPQEAQTPLKERSYRGSSLLLRQRIWRYELP